jgi:uroporphyrinogen decarboxylase
MNSVERVHLALRRQQPDRVPIVEFGVDDAVAKAAVPGCKDVADCLDKLDMDLVGCPALFQRVVEHGDGTYLDEWGVRYKSSREIVAHPIEGPVKTLADARAYTPPDPDAPYRLGKLPELVRRYKGRRAIAFHHRAAFMWSAFIMGLDNLLAAFLAEPETAVCLMDKVLECNMRIARYAIRAGAEIIVLGDDYAHNKGPLMSPELFREFIAPRLAKMVDLIHDEGAFCIKHTDGYLYPILDMIIAAGPDGLNPIEPAAGMELRRVKARYGARICLVGNIDCAQLLVHGTEEEVWEAVRRAIDDAATGGGFMLSSSNSIHSGCNPRNFVAMVEAAKALGAYG